jgi:parallel beta-helix repeat protein
MQLNKLSLGSLSVITLSVILITLGERIAFFLISNALLIFNIKLELVDIVFWFQNMPWFGLPLEITGALLISYFLLRSKMKVDMSKTKRQLLKVSVMSGIVLMLVCSIFASTPTAQADLVATTNYYLRTPLPIADMYIGKYTNTSYFMIQGSNWNNIMVTSNKTAIEVSAFGNMTSGSVWMKEVTHDLSLTVPANIVVTESVNGAERRFGNVANTQGSPYTISVGSGSESSYYFGEDRKGTVVWTSTNYSSAVNNAVSLGGTVKVADGNYVLTAPISLSVSNSVLDLGVANITKAFSGYMITNTETLTNIMVIGKGAILNGVSVTYTGSGVYFSNVSNSTIQGLNIQKQYDDGIRLAAGCNNNKIVSNTIITSQGIVGGTFACGIELSGTVANTLNNNIVENNYIADCGLGIYSFTGTNGTIITKNIVDHTTVSEGIDISNSANSEVTNNHVYNTKTIGIGLESDSLNCLVSENTIKNSTHSGIMVQDSLNTRVLGNDIRYSNQHGIIVLNSVNPIGRSHTTVSDNVIGNIQVPANYFDLDVENIYDVVITENQLLTNGMQIANLATNLTVTANNWVALAYWNATSVGSKIFGNMGGSNNFPVTPIMGNSAGEVLGDGNFYPLSGSYPSYSESYMKEVIPCDGTFNNFYATISASSGAGNTMLIRLRVNGANSAIYTTFTGATVSASDTAHTVHVVAGNTVAIMIDWTGGTPNATVRGNWGINFIPD